MVLGVTAKNKRGPSVHVDYLIHIQEIKPWPPSQSLRSLRSVLILWENGERNSGSTNTVVPSIGSVVGEGKIEFNESFRLPVNLLREVSVKGRDAEAFHKNCLEFNLYEPRRDKTQLLATAIIDLADYGVVKETLSVSAPMNSKRSFRNTAEPVLYLKIQPVDKGRASSSLRDSLSKQASLDKNGGESVSALMNEEYAEEAESTSSADDDVSSHSSLTVSSSAFETNGSLPPQNGENGPVKVTDSTKGVNKEHALASKMRLEKSNTMSHITRHENLKGSSSRSSSIDSSSDIGSPVNGHASAQNSPNSSAMSNVASNGVHSSSSSTTSENKGEEANARRKFNDHEDMAQEVQEKAANGRFGINGDAQQIRKENTFMCSSAEVASSAGSAQMIEKLGSINSGDAHVNGEDDGKAWRIGKNFVEEAATPDDMYNSSMEDVDGKKQEKNGEERQNLQEKKHYMGDEPSNISSRDASRNQVSLETDTLSLSRGNLGMKGNILKIDRLKHVKSVRSSLDSSRSNGLVTSNQNAEAKEFSVLGDAQNGAGSLRSNERKDAKIYLKDTRSAILDSKIQKLEHKIKMLEGELREAAAIEAALYSVMADHGSSMSKVHAPARRLSRLYLHESCQPRRASAARGAVSGLVLVAKACGNDVPRLTFWLSNSVVLRAIISQATGDPELPLSAGLPIERNGSGKGKNISSPLKWKEFSPNKKENKNLLHRSFGDWEDPRTFTSALERIEAWIFTRIIESIWWQTLTPHMQSAATKAIDRGIGSGSKKDYRRTSSSVDQDQENLSSELWKRAFKDACERLCPVRAGGHDCGCLPVLARLIMEQCVARLDVAMFNAILRESDDEIPTDPVSDPISDSKVLPIPAGKASFGAGAQLKNAIGNWSRWLTDLFGMDDDDVLEAENGRDDNDGRQDSSFKSFHLLNALSDLMMLPKDMLLSRSIRKEVCPTFGTPLIKRVLDNFVPDEFCPDPIPDIVLEALDSEDPLEAGQESVANAPCIAAPPVYLPPSAASLAAIISGEAGSQAQLRRSGSSVLRKSYTSDDELDELNSPLASIFMGASRSSPVPAKPSWRSKENGNQNAVRYELLRDIWMNSE